MPQRPEYHPEPINTSAVQLSPELKQLIERLAENNHELWAQGRIKEGWTQGKRRDDIRKEHPCLVPYNELPESEKEYDRAMAVETLKAILAVGFRILPPEDDAASEVGARDLLSELDALRQRLASREKLEIAELDVLWRAYDEKVWSLNPDLFRLLGDRFIRLGYHVTAHEVLTEARRVRPVPDLERDHLFGLALANSGVMHQAYKIANELREALPTDARPKLTEDVLGLLGRTHKDFALAAREPAQRTWHLSRALDAYSEAFRRTGGYYPAINAATLALLLGRDTDATHFAREAEKDALRKGASYWELATLGEAALVRGDRAEAERRYMEAVHMAGEDYRSIVSTRRQARMIVSHHGDDPRWVNTILRIPRVAVFAGHMIDQPGRLSPRFPPEAEASVGEAIAKRLRAVDAGFGFSAAACGSDILFLEAMSRMGGQTTVVLPYAREQFIQTSVATGSMGDWVRRFHDALSRATETIIASGTHVPASGVLFDYGNLLMLGLASVRSKELDTELVPVAFWDEQETSDVMESVVRQWREAGHEVTVISPAGVLREAGWEPSNV